jgi:hypothetical protein
MRVTQSGPIVDDIGMFGGVTAGELEAIARKLRP